MNPYLWAIGLVWLVCFVLACRFPSPDNYREPWWATAIFWFGFGPFWCLAWVGLGILKGYMRLRGAR